jgi:transcriptional regulator with XRE-family HTH domain
LLREAREAARAGDYGRVIELHRRERRFTQLQLGEGVGLSQSAVSRLEKRGVAGGYDLGLLARVGAHLNIPAGLLAWRTAQQDRKWIGGNSSAAWSRRQRHPSSHPCRTMQAKQQACA